MSHLPRLPLLLALLGTAAGAARPVPVATPAGDPVTCVQLAQLDHTEVRDDRTIDFYLRGGGRNGRVLRNVLPQACPQLGFERRFAFATSLSQLCNVDIITVLYQTPDLQRGASCGLGTFQPVTLAR